MHAQTKQKLDKFLASHERRAYQMALYATGNRDEALEIVQDSMFKLVQKYAARPEQEWPPLFTRIVQNRIKNWYRRQSVHRALFSWFEWGEEPNNDTELASAQPPLQASEHALAIGRMRPDKSAQSADFIDALECAIRRLPRRQQQVFLLRAVQGYDVSETSAAMQCSAGSVKTHYSRALHKLQEMLGDFEL